MYLERSSANYEMWRTQLSHSLLAQGVFIPLSTPPDLWSDRQCTTTERVSKLTEAWPALSTKVNIPSYVAKKWHGQNSLEVTIPEATRTVYELAFEGNRVRPKGSFPAWVTVEKWLNDLEIIICQFDKPAAVISKIETSTVSRFWSSGIDLAEFISAIQVGSDDFWQYFEKIPR